MKIDQSLFHVNSISKRRDYEVVAAINALPCLFFVGLVILFAELKWQNNPFFLLSLIGAFLSLIMIFFPFYSNSIIILSEEGILIKKRFSKKRIIKWSEINEITFESHQTFADYGKSIALIIHPGEEELRFRIYQYLFKSKEKITQELIKTVLKYPGMKDKLPGELSEKYS